jgi:DNA-binding HxlR family transcriptional regulator
MTVSAKHSAPTCDAALSRAFSVLGKRWNGVLIGTLIDGPAGFAQLARSIQGISESVLSDRLTELAATGLLTRLVHDGPPVTVTYELTSRGHALVPALNELGRWAQESLPVAE